MWVTTFFFVLCASVLSECLCMCFSSQTIYNAMLNGTPCVILESSGRIADVIAHVAGLPLSRVTPSLIDQLMKKFFGQEYKTFKNDDIQKLTETVRVHPDDLGCYRMKSHEILNNVIDSRNINIIIPFSCKSVWFMSSPTAALHMRVQSNPTLKKIHICVI